MLWREGDLGRDTPIGKGRQTVYLSLMVARARRHLTLKGQWDMEIRDREEL